MMRFLFFVLAFVAGLMAFVLGIMWLYAVAGGLILTALAMVVVVLKKQHSESKKPYTPYVPPSEGDLSSFGILEIRPKAASEKAEAPQSTGVSGDSMPSEDVDVVPHEPVALQEEAIIEDTVTIDTVEEEEAFADNEEVVGEIIVVDVTEMPEEHSDGIYQEPASLVVAEAEVEMDDLNIDEEDIVPIPSDLDLEAGMGAGGKVISVQACLKALQTTLGADTVCLLKQVDFEQKYAIESIVGKANLVKPSGRTFDFSKPLITEDLLVQPVGRLSAAASELELESLGYYHTMPDVQEVLFAIVRSPEPRAMYFLVADTTKQKRFDTPRSRAMMLHFGHAIGVALQPTEQEVTRKTAVRSRREIIAEEMARARANQQPLALALVHLNGDETLGAEGEDAILAAEEALESRIREATLRRGRVERFGELTYGVLYDGSLVEVEAWALQLHTMLAQQAGVFEYGVSIGAAVMREDHRTADAFRADATEAVMESYNSGECIIFE